MFQVSDEKDFDDDDEDELLSWVFDEASTTRVDLSEVSSLTTVIPGIPECLS